MASLAESFHTKKQANSTTTISSTSIIINEFKAQAAGSTVSYCGCLQLEPSGILQQWRCLLLHYRYVVSAKQLPPGDHDGWWPHHGETESWFPSVGYIHVYLCVLFKYCTVLYCSGSCKKSWTSRLQYRQLSVYAAVMMRVMLLKASMVWGVMMRVMLLVQLLHIAYQSRLYQYI